MKDAAETVRNPLSLQPAPTGLCYLLSKRKPQTGPLGVSKVTFPSPTKETPAGLPGLLIGSVMPPVLLLEAFPTPFFNVSVQLDSSSSRRRRRKQKEQQTATQSRHFLFVRWQWGTGGGGGACRPPGRAVQPIRCS